MDWQALQQEALLARNHAHCPYSGYAVGASLIDNRGRIYAGCNVENVSFGATICAERVVIGKMVSDGGRVVRGIVVATADGGYPCGICLQTLLEFRDRLAETQVMILGDTGSRTCLLSDLIPHAFEAFAKPKEK